MVRSMGVAYAVDCDKAAGLDVDAMQTAYLWTAGLKMVGLALIMGLATVLVSFFASRVGAGIVNSTKMMRPPSSAGSGSILMTARFKQIRMVKNP